jgi:ribosomal subunit interface protein
MKINIKVDKLEPTQAIKQYTEDKIVALEKLLNVDTDTIKVNAIVGKTSNHHQKGDIFLCEIIIETPKKQFVAKSIKDDLYASIDDVQDILRNEIVKYKDKLISKNQEGGLEDVFETEEVEE